MWHPLEKRLYWTDIETGRMFRYDPASGNHEQFYSGPRVGGFTVQPDGSLLLFRDKGNIALWRNGEIVKTIVEELPEEHAGRFNDVRADPQGRVFCGTLTNAAPNTGRLYRLDTDGRITKIRDDVKVANGIGFTPDLTQLYFTDTMRFTIFKFDYDRETGAISNERVFVKSPDHEGWPDGMTVDGAGDVWSARWDGHRLVRFGPDGREKQRIEFPCKKVSCCIFGGENLTDLYVTTAGAGLEGPFGGGWSVKLEYLYIDLGDTERTLATPALGPILTDTRRTTDNIVRVGLNYRWGGGGYGGGYGTGY